MSLKRPAKHYVEIELNQLYEGLSVQFIAHVIESKVDGTKNFLTVSDDLGEATIELDDVKEPLPKAAVVHIFAHYAEKHFTVDHIQHLPNFDFETYSAYTHKKVSSIISDQD